MNRPSNTNETNASRFATEVIADGLVGYQERITFQWIFFGIIGEVVCLFGTVTNAINIICFVNQGFKDDPVNVSLLGLAISDMGCLVTLLWTNICFVPLFHKTDLPFDTIETQYIITGWPHVIFTRVTSWITALITLERCMCITVPLKVKRIITSKRVGVTIVCVFIIMAASVSPVFYTTRLGMVHSPIKNKTILGLVYTEDRASVEAITYVINNVFGPFIAFLIIIVSTITLVVKLRDKARWRMNCVSNKNIDAASERDQKIAKMVVMISILFIACFIPASVIFMAMVVEPELSMGGRFENTLYVVYGLALNLESTNSSMNIFIYYHMSTKFRNTFHQLFRRRNKENCVHS